MNIIKNRYIYFLISLLVIIPGIVFMGINWQQTKAGPLQLGIDFRGGSLLEVHSKANAPLRRKSLHFTAISPQKNNPSPTLWFSLWVRVQSPSVPRR